MDVDRPRALSAEALGVLREGIHLVLSRWWALQMAVQNEWGGPDSSRKADQLASDIVSWFSQSRGILNYDFFLFIEYENFGLNLEFLCTKSYIVCTENENLVYKRPFFAALDWVLS
jgi:hypothetical protein